MWKRYLALAAVLLAMLIMLWSLAPQLYAFATTGVFGGQVLSFETINQEGSLRGGSQPESPEIFVIADAQDVTTLTQTALVIDPQIYDRQQQIVEQLSQLDYSRFFAILVLHGQRGSTGYSVTVQSITRRDNRVRIGARFTEPGFMEGAGPMSTDPYHLVAVAKEGSWGQPIEFELFVDGQVVAGTAHVIP